MNPSHHSSSRNPFLRVYKAFLHTPLYGRTLAVLGFLALGIKQTMLFVSSHVLYQEPTLWATLGHYAAYLMSDFFVFFVLIGCVAINTLISQKARRMVTNLFAVAILFFFVVDIVSLGTLQSGISIFDIGSGLFDPSVVKVTRSIFVIIIIAILLIMMVFVFAQTRFFRKRQKYYLIASIAIFALVGLLTGTLSRWHITLPDNILSSNRHAISGFFRDRLGRPTGTAQAYLSSFASIKADKQRPNVIVVFAESLSAIDSKLLGGEDNLPYFDKIQAEGMRFSNFLANGCTSDTAHIALLQGVEPWKFTWQEGETYSGYKIPTSALGQFFTEQGYHSTFLSTASLSFLNQRAFLSGVGFNTIIGEDMFDQQDSYVFDAAPDQVLYKKALQTIQTQKDNYFLALQTISFHRPYNTPYGSNEKDAIRYADKSLYYFYQQLKKSGFFDNGILIIVGDHRKMESMQSNEKEKFGPLRYAKAVATVIGTGITPGSVNTKIIQHTDFFYSLKKLIGQDNVTVSKFFNDVFSPKQGRNWGVVFCRYFTNRYGVTSTVTSGAGFEYVSDIKKIYPAVYSYIQSYSNYQNPLSTGNVKIGDDDHIALIAHRGILSETTENSLEGFLLAKKYGANGIEFDVSQTQDGVNVVLHGESLYPTVCGDKLKVTTHTLAWLQQNCPLTNGEKIRTLKEMLSELSGMFDYYFVELKVYSNNGIQQTLDAIDTVKQLGMEDKVIFTSYDKPVTYLLGATENIHVGRDTFDVNDIKLLPKFRHEYFLMPLENVQNTLVQEVNALGKKLVIYVVNTRDDLEKLYHQGIRIIMTDNIISMKEYADKLTLGQ